jgi:RHS repeat-associated protein
MATGYVVDVAVDIELAGPIPFELKRFYSSARRNDLRATLGPGWAHGWEMSIWEEGSVTVLRDAEGRSIFFDRIPVGGTTFHRGERMELKRLTADRWEIFHLTTRWTYQFEAFEAGGRAALRHIRDAWDNRVRLDYSDGRLLVVHDAVGREVHVVWAGQRIARLEVRVGGSCEQSVDYLFTEAGCLAAVTDALGSSEAYEYDAQRRMISATLKTDVTFRYEYEADTSRCSRTWGPKGLYDLTFQYEPERLVTTADGEEPRVYTLDERGHVIREALPGGLVLEERAYDEDGFLIAKVNGAGEGTKLWYDALGNLVRRVDADGGVTAWEYDERALPVRLRRSDGRTTTFIHDHRGALTRVVAHDGRGFSFQHDAQGRLVRTDEAEGRLHAYEYDAMGNLAAEVDAYGRRTTFAYDNAGRVVAITDALGRTRRLARDRLGRVTSVGNADGTSIAKAYDAGGNLVRVTDEQGQVTRMAYSGMGVLSRLTTPDGAIWVVTHTQQGRPRSVTNPKGETHTFNYDESGAVVSERTFDGREMRYVRDAAGRVAEIVHDDGSRRTFRYTRTGRVLEDAGSDGSTIRYKYDVAGRVVEATVTEPGFSHGLLVERDAMGRTVRARSGDRLIEYEYDVRGRVVGRTAAGARTEYEYDRHDRLVGFGYAGTRFAVEVDAVGRAGALFGPERRFALRLDYDLADRLTLSRPQRADGNAASEAASKYEYDRTGRIVSRICGPERDAFSYDPVGRLLSAATEGGTTRYDYDACGSVLGVARPRRETRWKVGPGNLLLSADGTKIDYDKLGRRTRQATLDANGNEAAITYRWDVRDRLREVGFPNGDKLSLRYDAWGRCVRKETFRRGDDVPAHVEELIWSGHHLVAIDEGTRRRAFVQEPGGFAPLLHQEDGELFLYQTDPNGAPTALLDMRGGVAWRGRVTNSGALDGEWHDPQRVMAGRTMNPPFRLLGHVADTSTGLSMSRFRWFDPATLRWLSRDPLGLGGNANAFGWTRSPLNVSDPLGLTEGSPHPSPGASARRVRPGGAAPGDSLERRGTAPETAADLQDQSTRAAAAGFPHGVSVTTRGRNEELGVPPSAVSSATRSELEAAGFPVHSTPTARDPNHHTVELPNPVTPEDADRFNQALGRTP